MGVLYITKVVQKKEARNKAIILVRQCLVKKCCTRVSRGVESRCVPPDWASRIKCWCRGGPTWDHPTAARSQHPTSLFWKCQKRSFPNHLAQTWAKCSPSNSHTYTSNNRTDNYLGENNLYIHEYYHVFVHFEWHIKRYNQWRKFFFYFAMLLFEFCHELHTLLVNFKSRKS